MRRITPVFALLATVLAGCAMTPASRIERNPEGFAALSPEQQQKVREGHVGIGFEPAAVRLAIGEPDRVIQRETVDGNTQIWVYYRLLHSPYGAGYCAPGFPYYQNRYHCQPVLSTQYEESARVLFREGRVVSVERDQ